MGKLDVYREELRSLSNTESAWDEYLQANSGLPGPRGNLELARAAALEGNLTLFERYANIDADVAPVNTPGEFLAFCGVLGYGRLLSEGDLSLIRKLRMHASDPRWRTREATAMAIQWWAEADMAAVLDEMAKWVQGNLLERRAVVAGLCEPKLLTDEANGRQVLELVDAVTTTILDEPDRRSDEFRALRKGLGYGWSVAVVAQPDIGKPMMEKWLPSEDRDIHWIMRENLKKKRLIRMDAEWTEAATRQLA